MNGQPLLRGWPDGAPRGALEIQGEGREGGRLGGLAFRDSRVPSSSLPFTGSTDSLCPWGPALPRVTQPTLPRFPVLTDTAQPIFVQEPQVSSQAYHTVPNCIEHVCVCMRRPHGHRHAHVHTDTGAEWGGWPASRHQPLSSSHFSRLREKLCCTIQIYFNTRNTGLNKIFIFFYR